MNKVIPSQRRKARRFAMQALYQWQLAGGAASKIEAQYRTDNNMKKVDVAYFHELLHQVIAQAEGLDAHFIPHLDRKLEEVGQVELAILRLGTYEMQSRIDVPYKVVINEGIELAKVFAAEESHRYINSILDHVASKLREVEVKAERK